MRRVRPLYAQVEQPAEIVAPVGLAQDPVERLDRQFVALVLRDEPAVRARRLRPPAPSRGRTPRRALPSGGALSSRGGSPSPLSLLSFFFFFLPPFAVSDRASSAPRRAVIASTNPAHWPAARAASSSAASAPSRPGASSYALRAQRERRRPSCR